MGIGSERGSNDGAGVILDDFGGVSGLLPEGKSDVACGSGLEDSGLEGSGLGASG